MLQDSDAADLPRFSLYIKSIWPITILSSGVKSARNQSSASRGIRNRFSIPVELGDILNRVNNEISRDLHNSKLIYCEPFLLKYQCVVSNWHCPDRKGIWSFAPIMQVLKCSGPHVIRMDLFRNMVQLQQNFDVVFSYK